jgi:iron complex outermembrane receptor protein
VVRFALIALLVGCLRLPFAVPVVALSEEAPLWPQPADTVHVTADRPAREEILSQKTGFSTFVSLGLDAPSDRDLGDLLDRTVGIHVHRYGGSGSLALASIRGSTPGQVKVCFDGVPIAAASDGFVNLSALPLSSLQHVEIFRGPQTASFGGAPAAGIINLVSDQATDLPARVSVGIGQYGARNISAQFSGGLQSVRGLQSARGLRSVRYLVSGEYRASKGDYPFQSDNGTPFNAQDDYEGIRRNNDLDDLHLLWKATGGNRRDAWVDYTGLYTDREHGVPGHKNLQTESVRFRTRRDRHQLTLGLRPRVPLRSRIEASIHALRVRDRFRNPTGEVGLSRAVTDDRTREEGMRLTLGVPIARLRQIPRVLLEWQRERFTPHDDLKDETGETRSRRQRTISVEEQVTLGRLRLEAAYRWIRATSDYGGPTQWGQAAGVGTETTHRDEGGAYGIRFRLDNGWTVKGNQGRITRLPTFPELFGTNGVQDGNPRLRPESGKQWDAGVEFAPNVPFRLETVYFERLVEDQIYLLQNSQRTVKADNLDRAWVRGVETIGFCSFRLPARATFEVQANHTWTEALDVGHSRTYHGKRIPNLPRNESYLSMQLGRNPWRFRWEIVARSSSFWHRYNQQQQKTPESTIHDVSIERFIHGRSWKARLEVRNVGDTRSEDIDGYPLPGRTVSAALTWTSD